MNDHVASAATVEANLMTAIEVVREAHVATSSLLVLLDERFARRGYAPAHPTSKNWVGLLQNGAQLGSVTNWIATLLHRGYLAHEPATNALIIDIDLKSDRYREPVLSMLGLAFFTPLAAMEFWKSWNWEASTVWHGGEIDVEKEIPEDALLDLFPKRPARGVGRVIRLCPLERQNVEQRVIEPAMACVSRAQELIGGMVRL